MEKVFKRSLRWKFYRNEISKRPISWSRHDMDMRTFIPFRVIPAAVAASTSTTGHSHIFLYTVLRFVRAFNTKINGFSTTPKIRSDRMTILSLLVLLLFLFRSFVAVAFAQKSKSLPFRIKTTQRISCTNWDLFAIISQYVRLSSCLCMFEPFAFISQAIRSRAPK